MKALSRKQYLRLPAIYVCTAVMLFTLLLLSVPCKALNTPQAASAIAVKLCDSLSFSRPVILDIRCGEWTPNLELEIRRVLLDRKVDLRETGTDRLYSESENIETDSLSTASNAGTDLLSQLGLLNADRLEITLEQTYETGEKRNLLSYSRYQIPVYRFTLKQIALPEQRLVAMREYRLNGEMELENPGSILALKWYEPIVATALIGSLLIMLWTLK